MAKGDVKINVSVDGERQFSQQMSNAAKTVKMLKAEEKAAEAQFRATGNAQEYQAAKARILQQQMEAQKKSVEAAKGAVDRLQNAGDAGDALTDWTTKLNNAETALYNMQAAAGSINTKFSLDRAIAVVDNLKSKIEGVARFSARVAKGLWDAEIAAGEWADTILTAAAEASLDPETYQSWKYASLFVDTEVENIIKARDRLSKTLHEATEEDLLTFNKWGIPNLKTNSDVRDSEAVLWNVIDHLHGIADANDKAYQAQKLFGDEYKKLMPLIEAGSAAYKDYAREGLEVATVSQEQIEALGGVSDANNKLLAVFDALKYKTMSALADPFTKAATALTETMTALSEFLDTQEGKEALDALGGAFTGLVENLTNFDAKNVIESATGAVEHLTDALNWIKEHGGAVTGILIAMGGAWAGLTVTKEVMEFARLLSIIPWAKIGGKGGGASGLSSAAESVTSAAGGSGLVGATSFLGFLGRLGLTAGSVVGLDQLWEKALGQRSVLKDIGYAAGVYNYTPFSGSGKDLYDEIKAAVADGMDAAQYTKEKYGTSTPGEIYTASTNRIQGLLDNGYKVDINKSLENLYAQLEDAMEKAQEAGEETVTKFAEGVTDTAPEAVDAAENLVKDVSDTVEEETSWFDIFGRNVGNGLARGITASAGRAEAAARAMAYRVQSAVRQSLLIASPSRVMADLGSYVAQGFAQGIERNVQAVERAVGGMVNATTRAPARSAQPTAAQGSAGGMMRAYIVMDKKIVGEMVAPTVDGYIGATVASIQRG